MTIRPATPADLDRLVPLFDAYRGFYGQPSDEALARSFLAERMARGESTVLLACGEDGSAAGFVQLYPTFCSVSAARIFVLYDLYVCPEARGHGVGAALLRAATDFARGARAVRLELSTAVNNTTARALYEREGWRPVDEFLVYSLTVA